jgi:hypothetical protein
MPQSYIWQQMVTELSASSKVIAVVQWSITSKHIAQQAQPSLHQHAHVCKPAQRNVCMPCMPMKYQSQTGPKLCIPSPTEMRKKPQHAVQCSLLQAHRPDITNYYYYYYYQLILLLTTTITRQPASANRKHHIPPQACALCCRSMWREL